MDLNQQSQILYNLWQTTEATYLIPQLAEIVHLGGSDEDTGGLGEQPVRHKGGARGQGEQCHILEVKGQCVHKQSDRLRHPKAVPAEQAVQVLRHWPPHAEQRGWPQLFRVAMAFNDPNTDGAVIVQREIGDNLIILTIFAMQI